MSRHFLSQILSCQLKHGVFWMEHIIGVKSVRAHHTMEQEQGCTSNSISYGVILCNFSFQEPVLLCRSCVDIAAFVVISKSSVRECSQRHGKHRQHSRIFTEGRSKFYELLYIWQLLGVHSRWTFQRKAIKATFRVLSKLYTTVRPQPRTTTQPSRIRPRN